jgi:hypothetical protein
LKQQSIIPASQKNHDPSNEKHDWKIVLCTGVDKVLLWAISPLCRGPNCIHSWATSVWTKFLLTSQWNQSRNMLFLVWIGSIQFVSSLFIMEDPRCVTYFIWSIIFQRRVFHHHTIPYD